jgi:hypothetical protein
VSSLAGIDGFIAGLAECGITTVVHHGVVTFAVTPIDGAHAGLEVEVGVCTEELGGWPAVPPHWVHLPGTITFTATNSQPSTIPGWLKHSRGTANWGDATHAAQAYVAHLRAIVGDAT